MLIEKINNLLKRNLSNPFFIETGSDNEIVLYTPQVLNNGRYVYIYIKEEKDKEITLSNDMYKYVSESISEFQKTKNILSDYFLNKKLFKNLIKDIEKENIKHSLFLEKTLNKNSNLLEEIVKYIMIISKYYNFIYDYSLIYSRDKEAKEYEFKKVIDTFVIEFNQKYKNKIIKLEDKLYNKIDYYEYNNTAIFTGIRTELDLHQAFGELEQKCKSNTKLKALILIDNSQISLVKYINDKFLKIYSTDKVKIIFNESYTKISDNISNFIGESKNEIQ